VISSLRGETERLLSEDTCGITYLAADAASFGEALFALEAADVRGRLARNARQTFENHFDARTVYGQLAEHLEAVARPSSTG
jgi:glycosyltransferase involved in cell wall biosynthesis